MADEHIAVWLDRTSEPGKASWIVSREDEYENSHTISVHRTKGAALKRARAAARSRDLPLKVENPSKRKTKTAAGPAKSKRKRVEYAEFTEPEFSQHLRSYSGGKRSKSRKPHGNPSVKLARTGHTGFLKARAVDVITRGGRVVEVRVKR